MMYTMACPVVFGEGTVAETGSRAKALGVTKALLVSDAYISTTDGHMRCAESLRGAGIEVVLFNNCPPDPPDTAVDEGGALAIAERVDGVVALGGGSVIDTAKAIAVLIANPPPLCQYFLRQDLQPGPPLIAIPTSSGTGSECSMAAVITDSRTGRKMQVFSTAQISIVDPTLTLSAPPALTVASALDALSHCCEAMTQTAAFASPFSDLLAQDGIRRIVQYLPIAQEDGANIEARRNLSIASNFGGIAMQNGTLHLGHSIAHVVGSALHITHGVACALMLPTLIRYSATYLPEKTRMVGEAMGLALVGKESAAQIGELVANDIRDFITDRKVPTFAQLGHSKTDVVALADQVMQEPTWYIIPRPVEKPELEQMLTDMVDTFA